MGILSILQIIFVVAKLFGLVAWSWTIVFIPAYIIAGIVMFWIAVVAYGWHGASKQFDEYDKKYFGDGKDRDD